MKNLKYGKKDFEGETSKELRQDSAGQDWVDWHANISLDSKAGRNIYMKYILLYSPISYFTLNFPVESII